MIELKSIAIHAGDFSLNDISFAVEDGQYAVLMGKTGRGKTTLLEVICGLRKPDSGHVIIGGTDVTWWQPGDRQIGYVPQDLALFPTLNVREHLEFALKLRSASATNIQQRTSHLADVLGIAHLLDRKVTALSGGESQRVALGRALSFQPKVLLLDEPLSALDEDTRSDMHTLLREIQKTTAVTTLHVTHSQEEARVLADVIFDLQDGVISKS